MYTVRCLLLKISYFKIAHCSQKKKKLLNIVLIQIPETGLGLLGHGRMLYVGMYFGVIQEDIIPIHCFAGTSVSNKFIKLNINQMCYSSVIRC